MLSSVIVASLLSIATADKNGWDEDATTTLAPSSYRDCTTIDVPTLHKDSNDRAMVCAPANAKPGERFPVIGYAHGDTLSPGDYERELKTMANEGFVVVAFKSCEDDDDCDDGREDYIELLKTLAHLDKATPTDKLPIDMKQPISVAGHSTGGRCVLMLAALAEPGTKYLDGKKEGMGLTTELRSYLPRIKAFLVDHGDEMYATTNDWSGMVDNPDPLRFRITSVPIFLWTGSDDTDIEPKNSTWRNFADYISSPERVFIDIRGEGHMRSTDDDPDSPKPFVHFIRTHAFNDTTAAKFFYDTPPGISNAVKIADPDQDNTANNLAGYVACSEKYHDVTVPSGNNALCNSKPRYKWVNGMWDVPKRCQGCFNGDDCEIPRDCF